MSHQDIDPFNRLLRAPAMWPFDSQLSTISDEIVVEILLIRLGMEREWARPTDALTRGRVIDVWAQVLSDARSLGAELTVGEASGELFDRLRSGGEIGADAEGLQREVARHENAAEMIGGDGSMNAAQARMLADVEKYLRRQ